MKKDIQLLIVPDVHGRTFWKDAVAANPDSPVVFLGDYLDPYPDDGIEDESVFDSYLEILELKRFRPDAVHLLWGNHDLAYLDRRFQCSREMKRTAGQYASLLARSQKDLLDMAYECAIGGRRFLFTHAGVSMGWLSVHRDFFRGMPIGADLFNLMFTIPELQEPLRNALADISPARGGEAPLGSPVWADVIEMMDPRMQIPGLVQVFGHSRQEVEPCCLKDHAYCLDCGRVFYIDPSGDIRDYVTDRVVGDDRYIFLDIDGVMTSSASSYRFDPECIARLGRLLEATDAHIVVSSSWKDITVAGTARRLTDTTDPVVGYNPFPFCDRIVGVTRDWPVVDEQYTRGKEIDAYLKSHSCRSYVIIDDIYDFLPPQEDHVVSTRDRFGLTDADVDKAIEILLR